MAVAPQSAIAIAMGTETNAFGPFVLDRHRKVVTRNGEPVPIGHRGYVLLEALLDANGEPVGKATLMDRAWPGTIVEEGNLTVQIATLRKQLGGDAEALIVTVPRVGYRLVVPSPSSEHKLTGPPRIAVLPFANLSSEAEQGYFADGVVDDIITALSRFKTFGVLSRGSTFALRDKAADARTAAAALGVRYALEGSVRRRPTACGLPPSSSTSAPALAFGQKNSMALSPTSSSSRTASPRTSSA